MLLVWLLARTFWLLVPRDEGLEPAFRPGRGHGQRPAGHLDLQMASFRQCATAPAGAEQCPGNHLEPEPARHPRRCRPAQGIAVIADAQGVERAWRAGEEISVGVSLDEVYSDRVVLLHDGVQEVLTLTRDEQLGPSRTASDRQRGGAPLRNTAPRRRVRERSRISRRSTCRRDRSNWQQTMDKVGGSPAELARNVRVDPVIDNGAHRRRAGFRRQRRCRACWPGSACGPATSSPRSTACRSIRWRAASRSSKACVMPTACASPSPAMGMPAEISVQLR